MKNKFKVGDKVRVISNDYGVSEDIELTVKRGPIGDEQGGNYYFLETDEIVLGDHLVNANIKKQRIAALEETVAKQGEEIAELKLIVHQLRGPSTIVEDIIEFEGKQYKKVDREAQDGDVIVFTESEVGFVTAGKTYKAIGRHFVDDDGDEINIYHGMANGSTETVDVYELMDGYNPQIPILEESNVKSPNQQRAEVIEKAKTFVDENGGDDFHFEVDEKERQILAWKVARKGNGNEAVTGLATCHPNNVYNEHIGKAIALGRALGLDVSEFENAVQPTELAEGQNIKWDENDSVFTFERFSNRGVEVGSAGFFARKTYDNGHLTIINDTNAEYEVNA